MSPLADPVAEGKRIAEAAAEQGVPLRLVGGVAIAVRCPSSQSPPLRREYADVDLATVGAAQGETIKLMEGLGYEPDREFNVVHGHRRLYFRDSANQRHVDVFVDEANLCHRLTLRGRIEVVPLTLPLADLTVLKLQVVETNEKDYQDLCALFADHDLSEDESGINASYIAGLASSDWGLWRTLQMVAERTERFAEERLGFGEADLVAERLQRLRSQLDSVPKTRGWKLRARVGERKRWYELPEEVH
jgi:hypothetical protein